MIGDLFRRDTADGTVPIRKRRVNNCIGSDGGVAADADRSEQFGTGTDIYVVPQHRRTGSLLAGGAADVDADMDTAVFSYLGVTADNDRPDVDQGQPLAEHIDGDGPLIPVAQADMTEAQQLADYPS